VTQSSDLAARYGRTQRPRWLWPLVALVGCSIGVAFAAWVGFQDKPISSRVWGYDVKDDHHVTITIDLVTKEPSVAVRCTVYAQADDHATVGEKSEDIPASTRRERRIAIDVETERRAVTGILRGCDVLD